MLQHAHAVGYSSNNSMASTSDLGIVRDCIAAARSLVVLTGAGISADSGVPTFRGADGLWRNFRAEDLATPEAFERDHALCGNGTTGGAN